MSKPWFEPKRYGYGAGLPISWEGWALLGGFIALVAGCGLVLEWYPAIGRLAAPAVIFPAIAVLIIVSKERTRGGWRWRWGGKD